MMLLENAVLAAAPGAPSATVAQWVRARAAEGAAEADALGALLDLDAAGRVELRLPTDDPALARLYGSAGRAAPDPGLAYVAAYESRWPESRALFDFVGARDYNGLLKAFERDVYLRHLGPRLDGVPAGARVLDAGCGVGRFSAELLRRGFVVDGLDASSSALKRAARHALATGDGARFSVHLGDSRRMTMFADATFDAVLALELVCYHPDTKASLAELVRAAKPGGLVAVSVEGAYAAGLRAPGDELFVRYFSREELRLEMQGAGLEGVVVVGTHYLPEGVLDRLVDEETLSDPVRRARAMEHELACELDPALAPLARAWLAFGRKPERA